MYVMYVCMSSSILRLIMRHDSEKQPLSEELNNSNVIIVLKFRLIAFAILQFLYGHSNKAFGNLI